MTIVESSYNGLKYRIRITHRPDCLRFAARWDFGKVAASTVLNKNFQRIIMAFFSNLFRPDIHQLTVEKDYEGLIRATDSRDKQVRTDAVIALADLACTQTQACSSLAEHLSNFKPDVREALSEYLPTLSIAKKLEDLLATRYRVYHFQETLQLLLAAQDPGTIRFLQAMILETCLFDENQDFMLTALETLGWTPGKDQLSAVYWISKRQFEACLEIGQEAIEPLIAFIKAATLENELDQAVLYLKRLRGEGPSDLTAFLKEKGVSGAKIQLITRGQKVQNTPDLPPPAKDKFSLFGDPEKISTFLIAIQRGDERIKTAAKEELERAIERDNSLTDTLVKAVASNKPYAGIMLQPADLWAIGSSTVQPLSEKTVQFAKKYRDSLDRASVQAKSSPEFLNTAAPLEEELLRYVNLLLELKKKDTQGKYQVAYSSAAAALRAVGDAFSSYSQTHAHPAEMDASDAPLKRVDNRSQVYYWLASSLALIEQGGRV